MSDFLRDAETGQLVLTEDGDPQLTPEAQTTREQQLADVREQAIAEARTSVEAEVESVRAEVTNAVTAYRDTLLQANPTIPAELVSGGTVEEVNSSLQRANTIVDQVRAAIAEQQKTPLGFRPGAPARDTEPAPAQSALGKIAQGLQERRQ